VKITHDQKLSIDDTFLILSRHEEKVNPTKILCILNFGGDSVLILTGEHFKTRMPWAMTVYFQLGSRKLQVHTIIVLVGSLFYVVLMTFVDTMWVAVATITFA